MQEIRHMKTKTKSVYIFPKAFKCIINTEMELKPDKVISPSDDN